MTDFDDKICPRRTAAPPSCSSEHSTTRLRSPGIRQTQIRPSDCQMVKRDSSLQRTRFHCSRVQWRRALHHSSHFGKSNLLSM
ncbi:hypothetical protein J4Q44_G00152830 [Coregonus suidteri]|uniref:Uncharacterized protein n=1 Tax=Coregonus suidteri TaxID=861788 RepID=A0AAN8LPX5_9TELE